MRRSYHNALLSGLVATICTSTSSAGDDPLTFNHDIRPVLSENCFACHGPDENDRAADLRLDQFEAAVDYGAITPNAPDESLIVERIFSDDPELVMPPPETGKKLTPEQKQRLVKWINQGAAYQAHWSFEPVPESVAVPEAAGDWPRNPIDNFVLRKLRQKGLDPSTEADRSTWLRRVTFDLTGLPPTLEELDSFLADDSDNAYEKVVGRLLRSAAYGERMANMWLDVARYADTFGYQSDVAMEVWPWREWVIKAFSRNMRYDQFITEQIAGDLLPNATVDQKLATTFHRLHRQTNEGGSIPEEFRLTGIADRTTTFGTAFLGLTLECCRCHDHKFDAIRQKEFYQLSAYFSDIDELGVYSHFTFSAPTPAMPLYDGDQREQHEAARVKVAEAEQRLANAVRLSRRNWKLRSDELISKLPEPPAPVYSHPLDGEAEGVFGKSTVCNGDDEIKCAEAPLFGRTSPLSYSIWVNPAEEKARMIVLHQSRAAEDSGFRGIQLTIDQGHPEFSMIHFWPGNAVRIRAQEPVRSGQWSHVAVTHDGSGRADGLRLFIDGKLAEVSVVRDKLTRDVRHRSEWGDMDIENIRLALGARFRDIGFRHGKLDELNVYDRQLSAAEVRSIYRQADRGVNDTELDMDTAIEHQMLTADESVAEARRLLQEARDNENEVFSGVRMIMTMQHDENAPPTHVLHRGNYASKGELVKPSTPSLSRELVSAGKDRLSLARWMTDERNPLTARVMVNRMWYLFFGRGIVVSLEDFGSQGTPPTHPELLDYLARSFMDSGWDLHELCRQIVSSATYRQCSKPDQPSLYERDPDNAWLARGPKHRLSAEQLRDTVLAASGLLVKKIGGPSVMPYQPAGLWREAGTGKSYRQSAGEGLYRRSLYTFWKRTSPPPSMLTFDATSRESCTARRELTTTPLQALVFLNDPQYIEASRVLAQTLIENNQHDQKQRWNELFRRLICRLPSDKEQAVIEHLYNEQLDYFQQQVRSADQFLAVGTQPTDSPTDSIDLAATTVVVQAMFAYDETIMLR